LTGQPDVDREWTLEEKFKQAKKAGFDGMGGGSDLEVVGLCRKYGMDYVCYIDGNMKTYRQKREAAQAVHPVRINVQLCDHDTPPRTWFGYPMGRCSIQFFSGLLTRLL
jgi:hypothetical protein